MAGTEGRCKARQCVLVAPSPFIDTPLPPPLLPLSPVPPPGPTLDPQQTSRTAHLLPSPELCHMPTSGVCLLRLTCTLACRWEANNFPWPESAEQAHAFTKSSKASEPKGAELQEAGNEIPARAEPRAELKARAPQLIVTDNMGGTELKPGPVSPLPSGSPVSFRQGIRSQRSVHPRIHSPGIFGHGDGAEEEVAHPLDREMSPAADKVRGALTALDSPPDKSPADRRNSSGTYEMARVLHSMQVSPPLVFLLSLPGVPLSVPITYRPSVAVKLRLAVFFSSHPLLPPLVVCPFRPPFSPHNRTPYAPHVPSNILHTMCPLIRTHRPSSLLPFGLLHPCLLCFPYSANYLAQRSSHVYQPTSLVQTTAATPTSDSKTWCPCLFAQAETSTTEKVHPPHDLSRFASKQKSLIPGEPPNPKAPVRATSNLKPMPEGHQPPGAGPQVKDNCGETEHMFETSSEEGDEVKIEDEEGKRVNRLNPPGQEEPKKSKGKEPQADWKQQPQPPLKAASKPQKNPPAAPKETGDKKQKLKQKAVSADSGQNGRAGGGGRRLATRRVRRGRRTWVGSTAWHCLLWRSGARSASPSDPSLCSPASQCLVSASARQ